MFTTFDPSSSASAPATAVQAAQPLRFSITGSDFLLQGTFDQWLPLALEGGGNDESAAQLFLDTTSVVRDAVEPLFSFSATSVKPVGPLSYVAQGQVVSGDVQRGAQAVVQMPTEHTPFAVITVELEPEAFPDVWSELGAMVAARGPGELKFSPRAWVRIPDVASA